MKARDLIKMVEAAGFWLARSSGHLIYTNGTVSIAIPHAREINGKTAHFVLKKAGLK